LLQRPIEPSETNPEELLRLDLATWLTSAEFLMGNQISMYLICSDLWLKQP
jgi:hypothetical protein